MREIDVQPGIFMASHKDSGEDISPSFPRKKAEVRRSLVEWSLESGVWNSLTTRQRTVLELRFRDDNPLHSSAAAIELGITYSSLLITEKAAMEKIERIQQEREAEVYSGPNSTAVQASEEQKGSPPRPYGRHTPERQKMVEWALDSGYWNQLVRTQRVVLEYRFRPDNPLTIREIADILENERQAAALTEKQAFKKLAQLKSRQEFIDKAKLDERWNRLNANQRRILNALYSFPPKTYAQAARELGKSNVPISRDSEKNAFARLSQEYAPSDVLPKALETGAWNDLPLLWRIVLELRFGPKEASTKEVAEELGMSYASVYHAEKRAFKQIEHALRAQEESSEK